MIHTLSRKVATYLARELGYDQERQAILEFSLAVNLSSLVGYLWLILIAGLLGILPEALAAAITASTLRVSSGGAHASCPKNCTLIGLAVFLTIPFLTKIFSINYLPFLVISALIIGIPILIRYAPADTPGKPITSKLQIQTLKRNSLIILGLTVLIQGLLLNYQWNPTLVLSSCLGLIWQLFTLTPVGYKTVAKLNRLTNCIKV